MKATVSCDSCTGSWCSLNSSSAAWESDHTLRKDSYWSMCWSSWILLLNHFAHFDIFINCRNRTNRRQPYNMDVSRARLMSWKPGLMQSELVVDVESALFTTSWQMELRTYEPATWSMASRCYLADVKGLLRALNWGNSSMNKSGICVAVLNWWYSQWTRPVPLNRMSPIVRE